MNYLIVYNHTQTDIAINIHNTIISLLSVYDWWHYLPNVYIVSSPKTEKQIADLIISNHPGLLFLVIKVDVKGANGVLNKDAWDWINRKTNIQGIKLKPIPLPPSLATILGVPLPKPQTTPSLQNFQAILNALKKRAETG